MTRAVQSLFRGWRDVSLIQGLLLLVIGFLSGVCGLWVSDASPPIMALSVSPVRPIVAPGETLQVRYDVERYRSCKSDIDRILFDAQRVRFTLEDLDYKAAPGPLGRDHFTVDVPIPRAFAPGPATYRVISRYECNVLHRLWPIVVSAEIPFEVRGLPSGDPRLVEIKP